MLLLFQFSLVFVGDLVIAGAELVPDNFLQLAFEFYDVHNSLFGRMFVLANPCPVIVHNPRKRARILQDSAARKTRRWNISGYS